ncbi:flavin reductase [Allorhizobium sp. BGMRC 0089]|uniref:flavin reductase n=1 Tax=Allorhizobium sonneratiae TaxID=2934936 RepID=UPI0020341EB6|nr:flavin reductase [Allorhizobium sonneratiae]MCM2293891.1 flavin reductase [Allorhizobium sonneratiae]
MNSIPTFMPPLEVASPVSGQDFRDAMAKLAAAVTIVTTDGPAGRAGFAATAVCSVSDSPATLLVCLNRSSSVFDTVMENGVACVNVLSSEHETLSSLFGGKTPVYQRFAAAEWQTGVTGSPMLANAMVSFDCMIASTVDVGSHRVLFLTVQALSQDPGEEALLYYRRSYRHLR